ncbi:glycosyltransferase family 2 protein [Agaribacterium sp. ZY112]|uniref:glycosyltransferase family 2 protein n=1 Tax=Agaribacterium sp. ZY112 TaxID=3233574 RepID=UPI0035269200
MSKYLPQKLKISVVFTTYNSPEWLNKVLWGYAFQDDTNYEIVIADDGSGDETRQIIDTFREQSGIDTQHIWHEDQGFEKCRILNKALVAARGDYIVMTDGDCIPRSDFLSVHRQYAEPGHFLSGGYFKLPMSTSKAISIDDIKAGRCFNKAWLIDNDVKPSLKFMKLTAGPIRQRIYNSLTPTNRTWNGHNASCFKSDAFKVNGFDERMKYGGLDAEFGWRLKNAGIKAKQIRYSAVCVHLDHARGYVNDADWKANRIIRNKTVNEKIIETPAGIKQLEKQT